MLKSKDIKLANFDMNNLPELMKGLDLSDRDLGILTGLLFRVYSANLTFTGDVFNGGGRLVKPGKVPARFDSVTNYFLDGLSISYDEYDIQIDNPFEKPNEKVAFVGDDKATEAFFKIIMGEDEDYEGEFKWGVTTSQSYFPKDNSKYFNDCELSLVDWLRQFTDGTVYEQDLRGWLGRVLFSGEEALKKANVLSGGEKVRCMLAKMMMEDANVLVFDELLLLYL